MYIAPLLMQGVGGQMAWAWGGRRHAWDRVGVLVEWAQLGRNGWAAWSFARAHRVAASATSITDRRHSVPVSAASVTNIGLMSHRLLGTLERARCAHTSVTMIELAGCAMMTSLRALPSLH